MKLYTGRGDEGMTDLMDGTRIAKTSARIEAYGTVDELNAVLGRAHPTGYDDLNDLLLTAQNHLHIIQAEFSNPDSGTETPRISDDHVTTVEDWIDDLQAQLEPLESFVLPGGCEVGSRLHHARAVCRRAERRAVAFAADNPVNDAAVVYLNRLSDLLFAAARTVNDREDVPEESPTY